MELPWSNYFYTIATLAMTFIGFCAIVITLHRTADKTVNIKILRQYTRGYIELGFSAACAALVPPMLAACGLTPPNLWRWSGAMIAVGFAAQVALVFKRYSVLAKGHIPPRIWVNQSITALIIVGLVGNIAGVPFAPHPGPVVVAATWRLVMAMTVFLLTYEDFLTAE